MLSTSQEWKNNLGNTLVANRPYTTPTELVKVEYTIDDETLTFLKTDLFNLTVTKSADLNSLSLPKDELKFEIDNSDGRFNPDNPTGLYEHIIERQQVVLYYGIIKADTTTEWVKAGTFYMSAWDCPQNGLTASFTATGLLDFGKDKFGTKEYLGTPTYAAVCKDAATHMGISAVDTYTWECWEAIPAYVEEDEELSLASGSTTSLLTGKTYSYNGNLFPTFNGSTGNFTMRVDAGRENTSVALQTGRIYVLSDTYLNSPIYDEITVDGYIYGVSASDIATLTVSTGAVTTTAATTLHHVHKSSSQTSYTQGTTQYADTTSADPTAYPNNGYQNGYWYVYKSATYADGMFLDESLYDYSVPTASSQTVYVWNKASVSSTQNSTRKYPISTTSMTVLTDLAAADQYYICWSTSVPTIVDGKFQAQIASLSTTYLTIPSGSAGPYRYCFLAKSTAAIGDLYSFSQYFKTSTTNFSYRIYPNGTVKNNSEAKGSGYVYSITTSKGSTDYGDVYSTDSTAYPTDGIQDGYWYTYTGTSTLSTVSLFSSTTDAAVIQYCANAAMCRIRYDANGKIYIEPMDTEGELTDFIIDSHTLTSQPEYNLTKYIKNVIYNNSLTVTLEDSGENQQISNTLISTQIQANLNAGWLGRVINTRKEINGSYHGDVRCQPYDYIRIYSKYALNEAFLTSVTVNYAGAWNIDFTARVMKSVPVADLYGLYYSSAKTRAGNTIS